MKALVVAVAFVLLVGNARAQSVAHDAKTDSMFRTLDNEAHRQHTARVAIGVSAVALGAVVGGGALYFHGRIQNDWFSGASYAVDYLFLGTGGVLMIEGGVLLAMQTPQEHLRDQFATDLAAGDPDARLHAQQAIDDYPRTMRHRQHIAAGISAGVLAIGLTSLYVMAKKDPLLDHTYGQALFATGFIATASGASGLVVSLVPMRSPFEKLETSTAMAPLIAPTHGGGLVGLTGTF